MKFYKSVLIIFLVWILIVVTCLVIKCTNINAKLPDSGIEVVGQTGKGYDAFVFRRIRDRETGVLYLMTNYGSSISVIPCFNADGTFMTWDDWDK